MIDEQRVTNRQPTQAQPLGEQHLRIAFCVPAIEPFQQAMAGSFVDAAYLQQQYIATGLQARGHQLTFVAPYGLDEVAATAQLDTLQLAPRTWSAQPWFQLASQSCWRLQRTLGLPYLNVFANWRRFDACLRCLPGHDLVYERNGLYNVGVARACQRLNLPYVLFFDADQLAEQAFIGKPITGLLHWRAQTLLRYNLNAADGIICVAEPARQQLIAQWQVPPEKITVFRNGVDITHFQPDPATRAAVRVELGLPANPIIIFVGNFYEWHDLTTLLDAFTYLVTIDPLARLFLVGDGPQRLAMMDRAASQGLAAAVHFTGLVDHGEVARLLAAADIAVAPAPRLQGELWLSPMKLFEYMAAGKAIVASSAGQLLEVIHDGQNGLLVAAGDVQAMGLALQRLLEQPALRQRLGAQARADAVRDYAWEHYLFRLEWLLRDVIKTRSARSVSPDRQHRQRQVW